MFHMCYYHQQACLFLGGMGGGGGLSLQPNFKKGGA